MTSPTHDRMSAHLDQHDTTPDDPAVATARAAVTIARARLHEVRRAFTRRQAGSTDVATAEAALSRALDRLDAAAGTGRRT